MKSLKTQTHKKAEEKAEYGRFIGVDVGSKRVGLARTDLLRIVANTIGTFSPEKALEELKRQTIEEGPVSGIVIGWPLTPQGEFTDATNLVRAFIKKVERILPRQDIFTMDERYSSKQAVQVMIESGVPKMKRREKGRVDQAAAAIILTNFLESNPEYR